MNSFCRCVESCCCAKWRFFRFCVSFLLSVFSLFFRFLAKIETIWISLFFFFFLMSTDSRRAPHTREDDNLLLAKLQTAGSIGASFSSFYERQHNTDDEQKKRFESSIKSRIIDLGLVPIQVTPRPPRHSATSIIIITTNANTQVSS